MMTGKEVYLYDMLVELNIATEEELNLAFNITDMCWLDTLNRVLYARTGYRSLEQYLEEEEEEEIWREPGFSGHFSSPMCV